MRATFDREEKSFGLNEMNVDRTGGGQESVSRSGCVVDTYRRPGPEQRRVIPWAPSGSPRGPAGPLISLEVEVTV